MKNFNNPGKVLALSPHPDDIEFGCGGFLNQLIERGTEVHSVIFSDCAKSVPEGFPKDVLINEMYSATQELGLKSKYVKVLDFPVRRFPEHRQDILEELVKFNREIKPDLILSPCSTDVHQDHHTIYEEGLRAFKYQTILGYEIPWNTISFNASALIELGDINLKNKLASLNCYQSQSFRHYCSEDVIRSLATIRGMQRGGKLAEAFEVIRVSVE